MKTIVWIIGANGLIGKSVRNAVRQHIDFDEFLGGTPNWKSESEFSNFANTQIPKFLSYVEETRSNWSITWLAGASRVGSTHFETSKELAFFYQFFTEFRKHLKKVKKTYLGQVFFASSAGALYSSPSVAPFNEFSSTNPISNYGNLKLEMEKILEKLHRQTGISVVIGRFSNVYGPGQSLGKSQGIISQLIISQLYPSKTTQIFVPYETRRDYLYVSDAASLVLRSISRAQLEEPSFHIKNIHSGVTSSISDLVWMVSKITKKPSNTVQVEKSETQLHTVDLRLTSSVWKEIDLLEVTPLPAGVFSCYMDVISAIQNQSLQNP